MQICLKSYANTGTKAVSRYKEASTPSFLFPRVKLKKKLPVKISFFFEYLHRHWHDSRSPVGHEIHIPHHMDKIFEVPLYKI
jgi:hypothetical protein